MWNLRKKANEQRKKKRETKTFNYREQIDVYQRGGDSGMDEVGDGD